MSDVTNSDRVHPLFALTVIVLLSLATAVVLFGVLSSTGFVGSDLGEFGGAAAGFFAALVLLQRWYRKMENDSNQAQSLETENKHLRQTLKNMNFPEFTVPPWKA